MDFLIEPFPLLIVFYFKSHQSPFFYESILNFSMKKGILKIKFLYFHSSEHRFNKITSRASWQAKILHGKRQNYKCKYFDEGNFTWTSINSEVKLILDYTRKIFSAYPIHFILGACLHTHKFLRGVSHKTPIVNHPTKKVVDQFWHNLWNFYEYPQKLDN